VPDPDAIIEGFYQEFEVLLALAAEAEVLASEAEVLASEAGVLAGQDAEISEKETARHNGDLQHVNGIGPTYATRLKEAGFQSADQLLTLPAEKLAEILGTSPHRAQNILAEVQKSAESP
jgi:polyhydroxyalkanoate synthase